MVSLISLSIELYFVNALLTGAYLLIHLAGRYKVVSVNKSRLRDKEVTSTTQISKFRYNST